MGKDGKMSEKMTLGAYARPEVVDTFDATELLGEVVGQGSAAGTVHGDVRFFTP